MYSPKFNPKNTVNHDIAITLDSGNWYVPVEPDSSYESSIGFFNDGQFVELIRGDKAQTPTVGISTTVDPEWKIPEDVFYSLISPYKFKSAFSMSALIYKDSEWASLNWPIISTVSSTDHIKKNGKYSE